MEYFIKFDENNHNCIIIFKDNIIWKMIACPPIEKGCDIISFNDNLSEGYNYNFDGLILITSKKFRKLYYKGDFIAQVERKN